MTAGAARPGDARWLRLRALFAELVELPEAARAEALARAASADAALAAELGALLAAADADEAREDPQRARVGAWRLEGLLAREPGSSLHRASHRARSTPATLRLVPVDGPEPVERLRALVPRLTRLRHPALVPWLECGLCTAPGSGAALYLVAPRLAGDAAAEHGAGAELLVEACEALAEAHAAGLAHGRLGPETVRIDGAGRLCILDLGLGELLAGAAPRPRAADDVQALAAALVRAAGDAGEVPEPVRRAVAGAAGALGAAELARAWRERGPAA